MSPAPRLLPAVTFQVMKGGRPATLASHDFFSGKNVALFGLAGAFLPKCHYIHLPEIAAEFESYKASGIDAVACTAVNDPFVLEAWRQSLSVPSEIIFLADGNGDFARGLGLLFEAQQLGLGVRSRRYAMLVSDGRIEELAVEPDPTLADVSSAYSLLRVYESWSSSRL